MSFPDSRTDLNGPGTLRLVLATRNAHKVVELRRILVAAGLPVELTGLEEFPGAPDVAETGLTFADNALLKARAIAQFTGLPSVADDSGLSVKQGRSARLRFAGRFNPRPPPTKRRATMQSGKPF